MAALLLYSIGQQNYELVRDRIASILKTEMDAQATRQTNTDLTGTFFIERYTPPSESEGNVICVNCEQCQYDNQTPVSQSNEVQYAIDIFCDSSQIGAVDGYELSGKKLARLAGLVRAILQSPVYDRLLFANGIVERRSVTNIRFARISDEQDSHFVRMARVVLVVRVNETVPGISGISAEGYDSSMKIELTNKGYKLTYNNE